jgi:outer membrane protein OmpA-like peptidoglycan-associated protein
VKKFFLLALFIPLIYHGGFAQTPDAPFGATRSFYQQRLEDKEAVYFTPDKYPVKADGKTDVSDALQQAIKDLKDKNNFGVLFIPEGKYLISKTIFVPRAIRLIGYGKTRPVIILAKNSPGFQTG